MERNEHGALEQRLAADAFGQESIVPAAIDGVRFRNVLGHYPTGVCVITSVGADGDRLAMVVGSFTSASLDPPLVAFFPDRSSSTWPRIAQRGLFCVNVLGRDQRALCRRFSARGGNKFADLSHRLSPSGMPVLDDVVAWIDCSVYATHDAGDHLIALGAVVDLEVVVPGAPLLFFQGGYGEFASLPDESHTGLR